MKFDMQDPWVPLLCFFEIRPPWGSFLPQWGEILTNPKVAHTWFTAMAKVRESQGIWKRSGKVRENHQIPEKVRESQGICKRPNFCLGIPKKNKKKNGGSISKKTKFTDKRSSTITKAKLPSRNNRFRLCSMCLRNESMAQSQRV